MRRARVVSAAILACAGCSSGDPAQPPPPTVDAGDPEGCEAGSALVGTECVAAGVPADACSGGFVHDGLGCTAVIPERPCPRGQMALPGETVCREVAPCAEGRWGDIPVDATTQYVDSAYAGGDSDGSPDRPWTTIQAGVIAADRGAIVAIAEGSYSEAVTAAYRVVRLWGVCPARVEIVGPVEMSTVFFGNAATGSEVRDLSITGDYGFTTIGDGVVSLHRVWIHDTDRAAVTVADLYGTPELQLTDSLIEDNGEVGMLLVGSRLLVERTVTRGTRASSMGLVAGGISSVAGIDSGARSWIAIRDSVLETNQGAGVVSLGGDLEVTGTLIRDTHPVAAGGQDGEGIVAALDDTSGHRTSAVVRSSLIERSREAGILIVDSDAEIEAVTVRGTLPQLSGPKDARGITVQRSTGMTVPPTAIVARSTIVDSAGFGVSVADGELTLTSVLVSGTTPEAAGGTFGDGVLVLALEADASARIASSRIDTSARAGVVSFGGRVDISTTRLECNGIDLDGEPSQHDSFSFVDGGGNECGCSGQQTTCKVLTSSLTPPEQP